MVANNLSVLTGRANKATPGELLQMYRSRAKLTQAELATLLGLKSFRMLQYWEGGYSLPKAEKLKKLIELFVERGVFMAGKELDEARQLWLNVKNASDAKLDSFSPYPIFDEHWLENVLKEQKPSTLVDVTPKISSRPVAAPATVRPLTNLTTPLTAFVGREEAVETVCARLRRPETRLLTITGTGGTGKTRLSQQVARQLLPDFEDGVYFVTLAAIRDPQLVASAIGRVLGVKEASANSLWATLVDSLKAYLRDRHLLLVLDNFEQVMEAASQVNELLSAAPMLKILVTSREVLHLYGETQYELSPMTSQEALTLFTERGQAVRPGFTITPDNQDLIVEICQKLDNLPLAIELAAARIKLFSPAALLARLNDRLGLLVGGARDLPRHQQTLRDTIEWSYRLLSPEEQQLFASLAIFAGGCDLEAVENICDLRLEENANTGISTAKTQDGSRSMAQDQSIVNPLDLLVSLVDKSIVRQRDDSRGEPRFSMLETIREYALDRLNESGLADYLRFRHAEYYTRLALEGETKFGGAEQVAWIKRLETEHHNFRVALDFLTSVADSSYQLAESSLHPYPPTSDSPHPTPDTRELALKLAGALWRFWWVRGYFTEGRARLKKAIEQAEAAGLTNTKAYGKALSVAGGLAYFQADYVNSRQLFETALPLRRAMQDKAGLSSTLNGLGLVLLIQGDYEGARTIHQESLELKRELGDLLGSATSLNNLGLIAQFQGRYSEAQALHEESLALRRTFKDKQGLGHSLNNLGEVAHLQGDYPKAQALYRESLAIRQEIGDKQGIAATLNCLGLTVQALGDLTEARRLHQESLTLRQELGDKRGIANCLIGFARLATLEAAQPSERAPRLFGVVSKLVEELGGRLDAVEQVEYEQALSRLKEQLDLSLFETAWEEGRKMELSQALVYAIE
jgi:predicted ATPase/transcriptional regulator with XRE-family HTH domain/Flp pilus assembly protein TadD